MLMCTSLTGWSQTATLMLPPDERATVSVLDCVTECEIAIMEVVDEAKAELQRAVVKAVAAERRHYEPRLARQTSLANDWKNEAKRSQGESLLAWIVTGVVGVLALIGFIT